MNGNKRAREIRKRAFALLRQWRLQRSWFRMMNRIASLNRLERARQSGIRKDQSWRA